MSSNLLKACTHERMERCSVRLKRQTKTPLVEATRRRKPAQCKDKCEDSGDGKFPGLGCVGSSQLTF